MKRFVVIILLFVIMLGGMSTVFPTNKPLATSVAGAGAFGGMITSPVLLCDDKIRFAVILTVPKFFGAPVVEKFVYTPPFVYETGPPSHVGQWMLGFSPGPDACSVEGVVFEGKKIFTLFGTSL